jgi:hypothetical protein
MPRDADGNAIITIRDFNMRKRVFADPTTGAESMKVDGSAAAVDEEVWNGEASYWADPSIGSKTTGSKRTGTYGWDTGATSQGNKVKFTRSTPFQPSSDRIEGWINLQALPAGVDLQARWELSNAGKGNGVVLQDYLAHQDLGVWQPWSIDIADFNLPAENVDEFRFRTLNDNGADYWLDDIRLVSGNPSKVFRLSPPGVGEWLVESVTLILVAPDTGWDSNSFCHIAGGLQNGLQLRHRDLAGSQNYWKLIAQNNMELFGQFDPVVDTTYNDSTRQISFVLKPGSATVKLTANDVLEFLVKDDLTGMTNARAFAQVGILVPDP